MIIDIVSALPEIVRGPLGESIPNRAVDKRLAEFRVHDLRDFATDKHRQVDDYLFGGGAGMLLKPEPIFDCIEAILESGEKEGYPVDEIIYMTPDGDRLTQSIANELSLKKHVVLLAGHYKGVDQRVRDELISREISIGDYVVSGGELPALVLVDAMIRLLPGVLGDASSALSDSFQDKLLDAPSYTRPSVFRGMKVPDVLRSGDHAKISQWRENMRVQKTKIRRPDLLACRDGSATEDD